MEEIIEQSANNVEVADPQIEEVIQEEVQETSVNDSEIADPKPVQDAETNARYAEERRNKEVNEYRTKATEYEQHLQKVAQITGYSSIDELIQAAQEAEQERHIQQEAHRLGMDEEAYKQYVAPVNEKLSTVEKQLEEMRFQAFQQQVNAELNELKKDENFPKFEQEMFELATKHKNMTLTEAYEFASLRGLKEQIPSLQQQAEQKVVDQIKARQGKHVETHDENAMVALNLTPEEIDYAQRMGISPEEYAKWK